MKKKTKTGKHLGFELFTTTRSLIFWATFDRFLVNPPKALRVWTCILDFWTFYPVCVVEDIRIPWSLGTVTYYLGTWYSTGGFPLEEFCEQCSESESESWFIWTWLFVVRREFFFASRSTIMHQHQLQGDSGKKKQKPSQNWTFFFEDFQLSFLQKIPKINFSKVFLAKTIFFLEISQQKAGALREVNKKNDRMMFFSGSDYSAKASCVIKTKSQRWTVSWSESMFY